MSAPDRQFRKQFRKPIHRAPSGGRLPFCLLAACTLLAPAPLVAGGPKYVAGPSYFNPAVLGQPVHWANGKLTYYVDQGPLNSQVSNAQAVAMVDAAAALWSAVPTAGVTLVDGGALNEDVSGSSTVAGNQVFAQPADLTPQATSYPVGVVFDADGSVINALYGSGASDATACQNDGVWFWIDNFQPDATIGHAVILVNGLCATSPELLEMMRFQLERAFGRVLGLDFSQVNPGAATNGEPNGTLGWPVMQPLSGLCGAQGGDCIPNPGTLRYDDIAALNRLYPITPANLLSFPGKELTAANTVSITGTLNFRRGTGMQGVNVVARPLDSSGKPMYQYTVTFVSGAYFCGKHGNPVTGWTDSRGNLLTRWGSNDPEVQGSFNLSGMPLPPGMSSATYQVTFEPVNALYMLTESVGPYVDGSPTPSGAMPTLTVDNLSAGGSQSLTVTIPDSAAAGFDDAIATESSPRLLAPGGLWTGRIGQVGQTDWFLFPVRANRTFTVVTQALDEAGNPTDSKALPAIGVWDGFDPPGSASVGWAPGLNGFATGETWLRVATASDDLVRVGIADMRGDGRPDYSYKGWVLYADSVEPKHLSVSGGPIVLRGMGFRPSDTVLVGGQPAIVTSISPNEITAIAPAAASGVTGSVDVEVDDLPLYYAAAVISGGVSYDSGTGDALHLDSAPSNTVPIGVPLAFTVTALDPALKPAPGVTVIYTALSGTATLGCGKTTCAVATTGDGMATMAVTAHDTNIAVVSAALTNGASLQAHFSGGTAPAIAAIAPALSVAAGATVSWPTQAIVLSNGTPISGQQVTWQTAPGSGMTAQSLTAALTNASGIATKTLTISPLAEGAEATATACVNGTSNCTTFTATGARPAYAYLVAVSGTAQSLAVSGTPAEIVLRLYDMNGNPMAGGTVTFYQSLHAWTPPCPPHGRCAAAPLLATQSSTAVSALDGTVTFVPASIPGVATTLNGLAVTGNSSTLAVLIEEHP
ncbi:MAG TPA: IPT/TIG domain-containing protein [Terracidiphilus sp.]|nr:IPT/TIG domain-containing protein [Terracidiphilus sp.]